jgi:antitoxin component of RelBE/YafQ-DinJ toxin-antitoxin module
MEGERIGQEMAATLERTITLDRDLTRRAERKLHRYGRTLDDAVAYIMTAVVSTRGEPQFVREQEDDQFFQEPNMAHLARVRADWKAGRNFHEHELVDLPDA